jgi:hypothetical protein
MRERGFSNRYDKLCRHISSRVLRSEADGPENARRCTASHGKGGKSREMGGVETQIFSFQRKETRVARSRLSPFTGVGAGEWTAIRASEHFQFSEAIWQRFDLGGENRTPSHPRDYSHLGQVPVTLTSQPGLFISVWMRAFRTVSIGMVPFFEPASPRSNSIQPSLKPSSIRMR